VTLTLDTGSPLRTLARYRELAQAILDAPVATQETDYVEWKSDVDLAEKRWQAQFSRHVLGFANREPEPAARWFGGCAYLVAGVSPGSLVGTAVHDTATIEAWLSAYVGQAPDAPEWAPTFVELHGKDILIVTIEAPEPGDPMWTCLKEFSDNQGGRGKLITRAGGIYVRHKASTDEAGPADIAMLSRRLTAIGRRVSGLSLVLLPGSIAQPVDFGDDKLDAWVEAERRALKPPPERPAAKVRESSTARRPAVAGGAGGASGTGQAEARKPLTAADILRRVAEMPEVAQAAANTFYEPDSRTREQYMAEVEKYLTKARKRMISVLLRKCYDRDLGRIKLAIRNETDDPVQDVQVELFIAAKSARAIYDDEIPETKLPSRPVMLGRLVRDRFAGLTTISAMPYLNMSRYEPPGLGSIGRRIEIDNSGSARITFDVGNLYPREAQQLDEFFLFAAYSIDPEPLSVMPGEWSAVTRNLSGVQSGSIEIPIASGVPTIDELLAEQPSEGDEQDDDDLDDLDD
jgi:hypothetical protein